MALIIVLIGTYIIYLINRKRFKAKTDGQKIVALIIYAVSMLLGMFVFFEILHVIKYHSLG